MKRFEIYKIMNVFFWVIGSCCLFVGSFFLYGELTAKDQQLATKNH